MMNKIREMPQESTPEETIRKLIGNLESFSGRAVRSALDRLFEILEQDPEIDVSPRLLRNQSFNADETRCRASWATRRGPWWPQP